MIRRLSYLIVVCILIAGNAPADNDGIKGITGDWEGVLDVQGTKLSLVFHIVEEHGHLQATMDSPSQSAFDIAVHIERKKDQLIIKIARLGITYSGNIGTDKISGKFTQGGKTFDLALEPSTQTPLNRKNRPQHPKPPFTYTNEEVQFTHPGDGHKLSGTLSYPASAGKKPAIILISGSGQQDRDQTILGHKPFLVVADHLTKAGFAVLRYDDRGVGKSTGDYSRSTSADFAEDGLAAFRFLRDHKYIDPVKIGLLGHSEGSTIAQLIASREKEVAFLISLAGPGVVGTEIYATQLYKLTVAQAVDANSVPARNRFMAFSRLASENPQSPEFKSLFYELYPSTTAEQLQQTKAVISSSWFQYFLHFDPGTILPKIKCPILAVHGGKDMQVDASTNLAAIKSILLASKHSDFKIKQFENLNHLFQTAKTGLPDEYAQIEETFSPTALEYITRWLEKRFLQKGSL